MDEVHGRISRPAGRPLNEVSAGAVSIVVPVRNGGAAFARCLAALNALRPAPDEIIVVDDASTDDSAPRAREAGAKVLSSLGAADGPAQARNRGTAAARGDILWFIDADVCVPPDAMQTIRKAFADDRELAALFGSYDESPAEANFCSQYKSLLHHYIHQHSQASATTFWAGCGAIRRAVFEQTGGFSAEYSRPSIEDIELGYRLHKRGLRIKLLKSLQVTHLKRWTLRTLVESDVRDRAIPWGRLILRERNLPADLNLKWEHRLSAALAALGLAALAGGLLNGVSLILAGLCALLLLALNIPLYRYFAARRGLAFAAAAVMMHWFYYLYSGMAFAYCVVESLLRKSSISSA